jgi:uncharacterized membrane protein
VRWGFIVVGLLLALSSAGWAQGRSYRISRFHDNVTVEENGDVIVDEQITFVFVGSFKGIHRRIPVQYPDEATHSNYTLFVDNFGVTGESGEKLKFDTKTRGDFIEFTIYIPGAEDTHKTVHINYTVRNGMRYFDNYDEFYWNVTGNDWKVPIDNASAFVVFPAAAAGKLKAQANTGAYGSRQSEASVDINGSNITFETTNPLPERWGLTIDIAAPKGIVAQPSALARVSWFLRSNLILLLPLFAFAVMFGMWYMVGRDPDPGMSVAPLYEPPKGMGPAEAGSLIDDRIDPRDITSTLVDLAVRGYIKIEEGEEKGLLFKSRDFILHLVKSPAEWDGLATFEIEILNNIFPGGADLTTLSSLKNRFYIAMPTIKRQIMDSLNSKGLYRTDPNTANGYAVVAVLLIAAPFIAAQVTGIYQFFRAPLMAVVAIVLALVPVFIFGRIMSSKTLKGARAYVGVQGFKEFMMRVDGDRLRKFPPNTFEKYLPFAMALGVETHWAKAFEGIIQNPPTWYVGSTPGSMFSPIYFTTSMGHMTTAAYEAFTAAPQASSSGSGFGGGDGGGGGFSGGGFGGGGGDAF